jgi:Mg2+ and Co2+ transporter CorA
MSAVISGFTTPSGTRDLLSSTLDSYLTQVSNRLAMATKILGVVATVTLPILAGLKWRKLL